MVTDVDLVPRGSAAIAYQADYPRPGWAEQHPRLWENALGPAIARALRAADTAPGSLRALGIADFAEFDRLAEAAGGYRLAAGLLPRRRQARARDTRSLHLSGFGRG